MKKRRTATTTDTPLKFELIPETSDVGKPIHERLWTILDAHHVELATTRVKIALAWATSWKPDVDGHLMLGQCKKASELDRELHAYDFVILLNKPFWQDTRVTDVQRNALLDHELCHCGLQTDKESGEIKTDARGRVQYRLVKHDIEEFAGVVARHGLYKGDLESFADAILRAERKSKGTWISYSAVQETLRAIGIDVAKDVIATWPDHQRREVHTWALLQNDGETRVNLATTPTMPACLAAAVRPTPPTAELH